MTMERAEEQPRRRGRKPAGPAEIEQWAKRVERWKDSGLTAKDFANEIGVEPHQLVRWHVKLRKRAGAPPLRKKRESVVRLVPTTRSATEAPPLRKKRESVVRLVPTTRSATEAPPLRKKRESADVWAERIQRWKDSGKSAQDFAAEIGVPKNYLHVWNRKLKMLGKPAKAARAKPAPKVVQQTGSGFELVIGNGMTLRVAQDFDEAALSRLVRVLGRG